MGRRSVISSVLIFAPAQQATESSWVAPAIVAAVVAAAVSLTTFALTVRRARLDRQRQVFADAFEAVMEYREYPFIVRRRSKDEQAKERARISGELSKGQARLNGFKARLRVEAPEVGKHYATLVAETRRVAGPMITEAWNTEPVEADSQVHNPGWDFSPLDDYDDAYVQVVTDHLGWVYAPLRQKVREWRERGERPS
jgi:hypothetical protein